MFGKKHKQWSAAPAMQLDPAKKYTASLETNKGTIEVELLASEALCTQGLVPKKDLAQMKARAAFSIETGTERKAGSRRRSAGGGVVRRSPAATRQVFLSCSWSVRRGRSTRFRGARSGGITAWPRSVPTSPGMCRPARPNNPNPTRGICAWAAPARRRRSL